MNIVTVSEMLKGKMEEEDSWGVFEIRHTDHKESDIAAIRSTEIPLLWDELVNHRGYTYCHICGWFTSPEQQSPTKEYESLARMFLSYVDYGLDLDKVEIRYKLML